MTSTAPISFARGAPSLDIIAVDALKAAADRAFTNDPAGSFAYGTSRGYLPLRDWIADYQQVQPEQVILTNGSMQADAFLFDLLVQPGDTVVVEAPSYDRTLLGLRNRGAEILAIPLQEDPSTWRSPSAAARITRPRGPRGSRTRCGYRVARARSAAAVARCSSATEISLSSHAAPTSSSAGAITSQWTSSAATPPLRHWRSTVDAASASPARSVANRSSTSLAGARPRPAEDESDRSRAVAPQAACGRVAAARRSAAAARSARAAARSSAARTRAASHRAR
jgi:hypothetical protein